MDGDTPSYATKRQANNHLASPCDSSEKPVKMAKVGGESPFPSTATTSKDTAETEKPRTMGRSAQEGQLGDRAIAHKLQVAKDMQEATGLVKVAPGGRNRCVPMTTPQIAAALIVTSVLIPAARDICFR